MWTGNVRAKWHDYSGRAIYHLTLIKESYSFRTSALASAESRAPMTLTSAPKASC